MKRAAVVAALALAAAACEPAPPVYPATDLTLYWRFIGAQGDVFGDYSTVNPGCWTASVDQVRITLTNPAGPQPPVIVNCVQSNGSPGVVLPTWAGPNSWLVEGLRTGLPVFSVTGSVNVPDPLGATMDLDLHALYGDMNLFYDLPATAACFAGDTVQLALYDYDYVPSRLAYTTDYPGFTIPIPCNYPPLAPPNGPDNFIVIPSLATSSGTGYYRFNYISVIRGGLAVYQICNPPGFSWNGLTQDVGYTLPVAAGTCPLLPP
jgi:hypothetical protein